MNGSIVSMYKNKNTSQLYQTNDTFFESNFTRTPSTLSLFLSYLQRRTKRSSYLTQHISPRRYRVNSRYRQHARGRTTPTSEAIYIETRDNGNEGPGKQLRGSSSDISEGKALKWRWRSRVETRECLERISGGRKVVDTSRLEIGSAAAALAVIAMITSAPGWLVYVRTVYTFLQVPYIGRFTARDARLRQRSVPVPV